MEVLAIIGIGILAVLWSKRSTAATASLISDQTAKAAVAADPATQAEIVAVNDQLAVRVAYDVNADKAQILKAGDTIISTAIGGLAAAASQTATGVFILSASAWTIIGGIVAGIFTLVNALRSDAHLYANVLVIKYENPFGAYVIQAQQYIEGGYQDKSLSSADAAAVTNAVALAWAKYQDAMANFQNKGGDWDVVATQSLENLDSGQGMGGAFYLDKSLPKKQLGNGFMTYWLGWMRGRVATIESEGR